jgi:hypothetical protein
VFGVGRIVSFRHLLHTGSGTHQNPSLMNNKGPFTGSKDGNEKFALISDKNTVCLTCVPLSDLKAQCLAYELLYAGGRSVGIVRLRTKATE